MFLVLEPQGFLFAIEVETQQVFWVGNWPSCFISFFNEIGSSDGFADGERHCGFPSLSHLPRVGAAVKML